MPRPWLVLAILSTAATVRADTATPLDLDFAVTAHGKGFLVRNAAYEMTFVNQPQAQPRDAPFPDGQIGHGAVMVDSPVKTGGDAGQGFVTVTILPVPADIKFDGDKGGDGTRDSVLTAHGHVDTLETAPATFGGLKGRESLAIGTSNAIPWK